MLSPGTIAKLHERAQHDFIHFRNLWFISLAISTIAVAVEVAWEGAQIWYEMKSIARERCKRFRYSLILEKRVHTAKMLGAIGWLLIVLGVAWEGYSEVKVHEYDERVGECTGAQMLKLQDKAGDAAISAKSAHEEADAVDAKSQEITGRLNAALKQIDMLGPRWQLLEDHKAEFIEAMRPFAPQRIILVSCGMTGGEALEPDRLRDDLNNFLGNNEGKKDGAGWVVDEKQATWPECRYATLGVPPGRRRHCTSPQ